MTEPQPKWVKDYKWWCEACGTLTNDGDCDCTKLHHTIHCQKLRRTIGLDWRDGGDGHNRVRRNKMRYWIMWIRVKINNALYRIGLAKHQMGIGRATEGTNSHTGGGGGGASTWTFGEGVAGVDTVLYKPRDHR